MTEEKTEGTLLHGEDGKLYFIPDAELEKFQLSEEDAREINEEEQPEVEGFGFGFGSKNPLGPLSGFAQTNPDSIMGAVRASFGVAGSSSSQKMGQKLALHRKSGPSMGNSKKRSSLGSDPCDFA